MINSFDEYDDPGLNEDQDSSTKIITDKTLEEIIRETAEKTAASFYKKLLDHEKTAREKKKENLIKRTEELFRSYRSIKLLIESDDEITPEEIADMRFKLVQDMLTNRTKTENEILEQAKSRETRRKNIERFERAVDLCEKDLTLTGSETRIRAIKYAKAYYMETEPITIEQLAEKEFTSERTVYRSLACAYEMVAGYLEMMI